MGCQRHLNSRLPPSPSRLLRTPPPAPLPARAASRPQEVFTRRMSAVFGGSKERRRGPLQRSVIIDFVVAGELPSFRTRERFSTTPVLEMPVHVPDIL